jgi:flagellar protein FliJ
LKRFRFRLEHVLRVRRLQEDLARADLMHAHREARAAADRVNSRVADYTNAPRPNGEQPYDEFSRVQFHLDNAAGAITVARAGYRHALAVVDDRRADWAAARQRVAALERLEERRRDEHAIEVRRADDRLVDDLVVAAHHPRGASE